MEKRAVKPHTGKKRIKHAPIVRYTWYVTLALASLFLLTLIISLALGKGGAVLYSESDTFGRTVSVDGIDVGGMTMSKARPIVASALAQKTSSLAYVLKGEEYTSNLYPADMGVYDNLEQTLTAAILFQNDSAAFSTYSEQNGVAYSGSAFSTTLSLQRDVLEARLLELSDYFYHAPKEPRAVPDRISSTPNFSFEDSENGYTLNVASTADKIEAMFLSGTYSSSITPDYDTLAPISTLEQVKANSVFYASFETFYNQSASAKHPDRIHNILKAAMLLNGCTVTPGEEFSFNGYIGPRTSEGGWLSAPGIVNGNSYVMQPGGGICQVSTTLHNALMRCGPEMDITLRKNHSWPSSYVDYGLDATVSTDGPDLKFVNNSGEPMYIFAYADNVNYRMTVYIYGKGLPQGVSYNVRATTDKVLEPEATVTVEEPTWPLGYSRTEIKSRKGYNTTAYRDKLVDGKVVDTQVLYHYYYRPVQGKVRVGTGDPSLPVPAL